MSKGNAQYSPLGLFCFNATVAAGVGVSCLIRRELFYSRNLFCASEQTEPLYLLLYVFSELNLVLLLCLQAMRLTALEDSDYESLSQRPSLL